jgi:hypothetical protein
MLKYSEHDLIISLLKQSHREDVAKAMYEELSKKYETTGSSINDITLTMEMIERNDGDILLKFRNPFDMDSVDACITLTEDTIYSNGLFHMKLNYEIKDINRAVVNLDNELALELFNIIQNFPKSK